jgi:predicted nucleic acid-binding protein
MGKNCLIDANIIIHFLNGDIPSEVYEEVSSIFIQSFNISIITKIEFLEWSGFSPEKYDEAKKFLNNSSIIPLDDTIAQQAINLKRQLRINLPDAVIAATCILNNYQLITRNSKDFQIISELQIFNPFI